MPSITDELLYCKYSNVLTVSYKIGHVEGTFVHYALISNQLGTKGVKNDGPYDSE